MKKIKINKKVFTVASLYEDTLCIGCTLDHDDIVNDAEYLQDGYGCGFPYTLDFAEYNLVDDGCGYGCGDDSYNQGDDDGDGGGDGYGPWGMGDGYGNTDGDGKGYYNEFLCENSNFALSF
jgi:hypothetical protein